jgi:sucrose phosphorylase
VYYVGLLAGTNDTELLRRTGVGRDINRHYYTRAEVEQALERPVVHELCRLIRFRNQHPAFDGDFSCPAAADHVLALRWRKGDDVAALEVDLRERRTTIRATGPRGMEEWTT